MRDKVNTGSCVRGYHIYKTIWSPTTGQEYSCEQEEVNSEDPYAVAIIAEGVSVVFTSLHVHLLLTGF